MRLLTGLGGLGRRRAASPRRPSAHDQEKAGAEAGLRAEFDQRLAEETRRSFEAGRERGRQEGPPGGTRGAGRGAGRGRNNARAGAELIESFARSATGICNRWSTRWWSWRWRWPRAFCAAKRRWTRCC
jgi:hypothetical protein